MVKSPLFSLFFFLDESKFCISFGNQGPEVWRGMLSELFEVQCEVYAICGDLGSSAGVGGGRSAAFYRVQSQSSRLPGDF